VLDAHSIRIKRTWERRINERVWKRHNAYGRRSISRLCWLPIVLQQKWSMYLLTWTRELSPYLRSFFHSSACTLCSLSLLFYYIRPSSILNSPRFHHFVFLMLLPVHTFFLHSSFLQFLTFPIPGRLIIIALSGDVQPRIKAPFPFQNILSRPWSVKISLTDGPSCWIHLVKPWICGLSSILHCRKNWAVGIMGRRNNGPSE
jgi:hypothetical protein